MLQQCPRTIPAEFRDYPEWHHGRRSYAVWLMQLENDAIAEQWKAARKHLSGYLLEPYCRQPHITLFVCGFLVEKPRYNDDFISTQLQRQVQALQKAGMEPFEIEVGGLNSFASAPFLEVSDPHGSIARIRSVLSGGAREFRTAPYIPHLTIGLYSAAFPSEEVAARMETFGRKPVRCVVEHITFATYVAQQIAGPLTYHKKFVLNTRRNF